MYSWRYGCVRDHPDELSQWWCTQTGMELFLSHATSDDVLAKDLVGQLEGLGIRTFRAEHDNRAGLNTHDQIQAAIRRCQVVVVLLTRAGQGSHYVHQEIGYAKSQGKLIIPVVTPEVAAEGLGMLEGIHYILVDQDDPSASLATLNNRVAELAAQRYFRDPQPAPVAALAMIAVGVILLAMLSNGQR